MAKIGLNPLNLLDRVKRALRVWPFNNFYVITGAAFVFWMLTFEHNNVWEQLQTYHKLQKAYEERDLLNQKLKDVETEREELLGTPEQLERFARERYLMKKPTEDIYLYGVDTTKPINMVGQD